MQVRCLRRGVALSLAAVVPLGLATKVYAGPGAAWVAGSVGGVFYVLFWCLLIRLIGPGWRPWRIAAGVLLATGALEFLQLWRTPLLEAARGTFLGRALIGDTFDWSDFPWYAAGCGLGWWWLARLEAWAARGR